MIDLLLASGTCFLAGFLTTLHPCPFTTSIASISFLAGWGGKSKRTYMVPLLFSAGFISAYLFIAIALSSGLFSIPALSRSLQHYISVLLGPLLVIAGMLLADLIRINRFYKDRILHWIMKRKWNGIKVFPMGVLIALSFCPATAGIFFGVLIPFSIKHGQTLLFPVIYSVGASIPLIVISLSVIHGIKLSGKSLWQGKLIKISGWILILTGIYLTIQHIYIPSFG